jgi:LAO/AO transport system kinase
MIGDAFKPDTFAEDAAKLAQKIEEHHIYLQQSGKLTERMHRKAMAEIKDALSACLLEPVLSSLAASGDLKHFAEKIKNRKADPYSVAEEIAQRFYKNREEK